MDVYRWAEKRIGGRLIRLHDTVYQKTNGRIGHRIPGLPPTLLLHTIGAKTGLPRTHALTYARDKDAYLIVASNSGSFRHPNWYYNLRKNPDVEINVGAKRFKVVARRVTLEDSDYQRLWQIVNKNNFNQYDRYQHRTSRPLSIFELTAGTA
jgi:deazaflavin-dependent oxidoreductase (nitroreductase family)